MCYIALKARTIITTNNSNDNITNNKNKQKQR